MQSVRRGSHRQHRKKHSIVLRVFLIAFVIYLVYLVFSITKATAGIADLEQEKARVDAAIVQQQMTNEELDEMAMNPDLYLEETARENGYVRPGEEIFKETPGN